MRSNFIRVLCLAAVFAAVAALFLFGAGADEPFVAESDVYCAALGDANGDRKITTADARAVMRSVLLLDELPDQVKSLCDLDGFKGLSTGDARFVLRMSIGLERRPAHKDKKTVTTQEPTCYEQGISAHICAYCGEYYNFGVVPERPHTAIGWKVEREPTCAKAGVKRQYCKYCGIQIAEETIPVTPHIYGPMHFVSDTPDCTRAQEVYRVCVNCGRRENGVRPGTDHTWSWVTVVEPTCTELGKQEQVCALCGMKSGNTQNTFSLGGHVPSGWIVVKYPTRTEEGLQHIICTRCGEVLEEEILPKKQ